MREQRILCPLVATVLFGLLYPVAAHAQGLDGAWTAVDNRGAITRIVVSFDASGQRRVHAYGACTPSECDWGSVPMTTYGASVSDTSAIAGIAGFRNSFSLTTVAISQYGSPDSLQMDVFTRFTDGSGRKNYAVHEVMQRPGAARRPAYSVWSSTVRYSRVLPTFAAATASAGPSQPEGRRTILPDGSVQITYPDGSSKIVGKDGVTTIAADGTKSYKPYQRTFLSAQPPTPPSAPDSQTSKWAKLEADSLLALISQLVGNDQSSIDNLLAREEQMFWYQKIDDRTAVLQTLTAQ